MAAGNITKESRTAYWILTVISWLLVLGPLLGYAIYGFCVGEPTQKVTLATTLMVAIVLTIISTLFKFHIRSTIFILILGIYMCIDEILPLIIILSVCTILDEFLISPLQKKYKNKTTINKEIDRRIT